MTSIRGLTGSAQNCDFRAALDGWEDAGTVETCTDDERTRQNAAVMHILGIGPPPPRLPLIQRIGERVGWVLGIRRFEPPFQGQAAHDAETHLSGAPSAYWTLPPPCPSATSVIPLTKYSMEVIFPM